MKEIKIKYFSDIEEIKKDAEKLAKNGYNSLATSLSAALDDIAKGMDIDIPCNYYIGDDPCVKPLLTWRSNANNLYTNWINYYVYQNTPYKRDDIGFRTMEECSVSDDKIEANDN